MHVINLLLIAQLSLNLNPAMRKEMYKSTERASVEITSLSEKTVNIEVDYFDLWTNDINHSALYLFVKSNQQSIAIKQISLSNECFKYKISENEKGLFLIPTKNDQLENCVNISIHYHSNLSEVQTYAIEMVHIPNGSFSLGSPRSVDDRNTINTSRGSLGAPLNAFFEAGTEGQYQGVYQVDSEKEIRLGDCNGCLNVVDAEIPGVNTYSGNKNGTLPSSFPKGYNSFYQMRYELTEQQYCDFLNAILPAQAAQRINLKDVFQGEDRTSYGNFIELINGRYVTSRPLQPCSFLSWNDCLAYSDWAGLRIMTELEFEKSARGFDKPKFREFVWGGSEINNQYFLDRSYYKCGEESYCVDGNIHVNYLGFSNYNDVCTGKGSDNSYIGCRTLSSELNYRGPLETGIHSKKDNNLNRITSGGGYFGTLDLSGNLREPIIPLGSEACRRYKGSTGDGRINPDGRADNLDWYYSKEEDLVYGYRGGCWAFHENHARIADRFNVYRKGVDIRTPYSGYRGVTN